MEHEFCKDCVHCDTGRTNEKTQVRCKRYSQYVSPLKLPCEEYASRNLVNFFKEMQKDYKLAERIYEK